MSRYEKQLEEEVKGRAQRDSFGLDGDRVHLTSSIANLSAEDYQRQHQQSHPDPSQHDETRSEWQRAVNNYRQNTQSSSQGGVSSHRSQVDRLESGNRSGWRHFRGRIVKRLSACMMILYTILICFGPLILVHTMHKSQWCPLYVDKSSNTTDSGSDVNEDTTTLSEKGIHYENPDYDSDQCRYTRLPLLFYLTIEEADLCTRMLLSIIMGGAIGYERRSSDRPAGVRTMSLVSLGSCFFTISSQLAFKNSTMSWDASRVTAAIPSGCSFLGAGLIWRGVVGEGKAERNEVHGLTTAAGVWLSAAIGVGCGGKLYFVSTYSTILVTTILRYGPKLYFSNHDYEDNYEKDSDNSETKKAIDQYCSEGDDDLSQDQDSSKDDICVEDEDLSSCTEDEKKLNISLRNLKGDQSTKGVQIALIDLEELQMFEAWRRERLKGGMKAVQRSEGGSIEETGSKPAVELPPKG